MLSMHGNSMLLQISDSCFVQAAAVTPDKCILPDTELPTLADYMASRIAERHMQEKLPILPATKPIPASTILFETQTHMARRDARHAEGDLRAALDAMVIELSEAARLPITPVAIQLVGASSGDDPKNGHWSDYGYFVARLVEVPEASLPEAG
jgi:hypothetical protein